MVEREYQSDGMPYDEVLDRKEIRRLQFWRWRLKRNPEVREPQTPIPKERVRKK